ncbi:MAG TPA: cytochrome bc complex cytochrome b subunit [Thermoanaerobaculia bacterium]|nr:cytochrome bc complex cytochrome b subunit [Thermoanaerobaculia bacterium]
MSAGERSRRGLAAWLNERLPISAARDFATHKTVPVHRYSVFYYLGGMTLFFFLVQVFTGILLMLYYRPSADEAFESVEFIMTTVPFGWLMRSVHSWSANLMVFFAFVHLATVYFVKAYRKPREVTWVSGVLLLFLVLGFGFSGYLLPWNQLAFFATKVGTDIAGAVPWIGEWLVRFLRGGERVTGGTLSRFYGWHVAILPAATTLLLGLHLLLVQIQGMSEPPWLRKREGGPRRPPMKFFPQFALRDLFGWTVALGVLAALAALFPWELGEKADPFAPAFAGIKPEWYFMFMFETLKLVPGGEILGIEYEAIPILLFGALGLVLLLVPFLDREKEREHPAWTWVGVIAVLYVVGFTAWGYRSVVPILVVLASGVLVLLLGVGTRHGESR